MTFKRMLVIDLFHGNKSFDKVEMVSVEKELPKEKSGIFKVRLANEEEVKAYWFEDKCSKLCFGPCKMKPSYWWKHDTKEPLYNVTHWGK